MAVDNFYTRASKAALASGVFGKIKKFFGFASDNQVNDEPIREVISAVEIKKDDAKSVLSDAEFSAKVSDVVGIFSKADFVSNDLSQEKIAAPFASKSGFVAAVEAKKSSISRSLPKMDTRWYEDEDVQKGLNRNNSQKQGVHIFGAVPTQFSDLLEQSVKTAKGQANRGQTALMPFNVNDNHWVGGVMTKVGKEVCFIHNDPMGNPINNSLKKELTAQGIAIIDLQKRQQQSGDAYNCGPFTVDNLTKFAEAAKNANQFGLTKEELTANLRIGFESGIQSGQDLRRSQSGNVSSQSSSESFADKVTQQRSFSSRGAGNSGENSGR